MRPTGSLELMCPPIGVELRSCSTKKLARLANRQPTPMQVLQQAHRLQNPDARIVFEHSSGELLKAYADSRYGLRTGDPQRFILKLWELDTVGNRWVFHRSLCTTVIEWGGGERA